MLGIAEDNIRISATISSAIDDISKIMKNQPFNDAEWFYKRFVLKGIITGVAQMSFNKGRKLGENDQDKNSAKS